MSSSQAIHFDYTLAQKLPLKMPIENENKKPQQQPFHTTQ